MDSVSEPCLYVRKHPSSLSLTPYLIFSIFHLFLSINHISNPSQFIPHYAHILSPSSIPFTLFRFSPTSSSNTTSHSNLHQNLNPLMATHPTFKVLIVLLLLFTVAFIFFLTVLDPHPKSEMGSEEGSKIGSKPPACENKCMKCRPCMATLVVPNHQRNKGFMSFRSAASRGEDDDTYYLLSWKCRCGNKLFQP